MTGLVLPMGTLAQTLAEQTRLRKTTDFKEGTKAMAERRLPDFQGR